jgi:hypothetical protein
MNDDAMGVIYPLILLPFKSHRYDIEMFLNASVAARKYGLMGVMRAAVKTPTSPPVIKFVDVAGSFQWSIDAYSNRSSKNDTSQPAISPPNILL